MSSNDPEAIHNLVETSAIRDDQGNPAPEEGYSPSLVRGDWHRPQSALTVGLAKLEAYAGVASPHSGASISFRGGEWIEPVREHSVELVQSMLEVWQPDLLVLTDTALLRNRRDRLPTPAPGRSFAPWGYHAWLSDRCSRDLEHVDGAVTSRFGPGTMLVTDTWNPQTTADTWLALAESRRIRGIRIGEAQERLPEF